MTGIRPVLRLCWFSTATEVVEEPSALDGFEASAEASIIWPQMISVRDMQSQTALTRQGLSHG